MTPISHPTAVQLLTPKAEPHIHGTCTPNNGMFPLGLLDQRQLSISMNFNRQFSGFCNNDMPETSTMSTRETTMAIYARHNIH
ncbi:hypothetical protein BDV3_000139 [Batrachochytrium dendrobatidis]